MKKSNWREASRHRKERDWVFSEGQRGVLIIGFLLQSAGSRECFCPGVAKYFEEDQEYQAEIGSILDSFDKTPDFILASKEL